MVQNPRSGRPYMRALAALKARGAVQECWRQTHPDCPKLLYADAPKGHPRSITLGHVVAFDVAPELFWEPSNHMPECMKCNYSDGARITNRKKRAARESRGRKQYRNPRW